MKNGNYYFFWNGPFSQWHKSRFMIDGTSYVTAEQYMMAMKARHFGDLDIEKQIMSTNNPKQQKALGRQVKNFNAKVWNEVSKDYVL